MRQTGAVEIMRISYTYAAFISGPSPESLLIVKNYTRQVFWLGFVLVPSHLA